MNLIKENTIKENTIRENTIKEISIKEISMEGVTDMATKNKTRYAILGVLTVSDCSGYDIKKYCDNILSHFWNENFGHIYPVLKQLLAEGTIVKIENEGSSRKITYGISAKGREEFLEWLIQPTEYAPVRSEFLLKLSFSNNMSNENTIRLITDYKALHHGRLEKYREMESYMEKDEKASRHTQKLYVMAPLRYGILSSEAVIRWCDEVIGMLNDSMEPIDSTI